MVQPVQYGGDEVSAIVLDIGSHSTRAGYAGEDCPKTIFPTSYATVPPTSEGEDPRYIHGLPSLLYRPTSTLSSPLTDGLITDWSALERTLDHAFKDRLRLETLEEYPLLVTEPSWNTKEAREKMLEVAMEQWDAPAYYAVDKAVMSSFAAGRGTSLVLSLSSSSTTLTPIYDGFVLRKAVQRQPLGGELLSEVLLSTIQGENGGEGATKKGREVVPNYCVKMKGEGVAPGQGGRGAVLREERLFDPSKPDGPPTSESYHKAAQLRVMHEFKEAVCEVYPSAWDDAGAAARPSRPFEFPDGFNAYYGTVRMSVPEILFNPSRFLPNQFTLRESLPSAATIPSHPYSSLQPLTKLFQNALVQIDPDLHAALLANVVVTGGTSLIPGLIDRLQAELGGLQPGMKLKIHAASSPAERMYSSWLGGSILASLGTFHQLWIGKDEYKELGAARLVKK